MKLFLKSILLLLAFSLPAGAKTYPSPLLDANNTFTFEVPRIITNALITVTHGGGWITMTTDTTVTTQQWVGGVDGAWTDVVTPGSETDRRWVQAPTVYPATFFKFTKLAKSVTFTALDALGKPLPLTTFTITNLIVKDRYPMTVVPVWYGTTKWQPDVGGPIYFVTTATDTKTMQTIDPITGAVLATATDKVYGGGPKYGPPTSFVNFTGLGTGAGPITFPLAYYDQGGVFLGTIDVVIPVQ
jgi:hypothetical protein